MRNGRFRDRQTYMPFQSPWTRAITLTRGLRSGPLKKLNTPTRTDKYRAHTKSVLGEWESREDACTCPRVMHVSTVGSLRDKDI